MNRNRRVVALATVLATVAALAGLTPGAFASKASIKAVLKSYSSKIDVAEGHTIAAIGEYKTTHEPVPVEQAIANSVSVISQVRTKIEHQSAGTPKVKTAKRKLVAGLGAIIAAYERLSTAYGDKSTSPTAAEAEGEKALVALKHGTKQLKEAAKLLR